LPRPRPRALAALVLVLLAVLAPAAGAKEGVVARLATPIERDAKPGSRVTVTWTLTRVVAGKRRPFGGGYAFVRLVGRTGSSSPRVYGANPAPGRYRATIRVPKGGLARVVIGIMGSRCDATGCRPEPKRFPLVGRVFR
jgi:hypothetical protein